MSKVDNGMVFEVWTLLSLVCECCKHMSRYMHDYCDFFLNMIEMIGLLFTVV